MKSNFFYYILAAGLTVSSCSQNSQQENAEVAESDVLIESYESTKSHESIENSFSLDDYELEEISQKIGLSINRNDNALLYSKVAEWIGTPYMYGGSEKSGADCSGFVNTLYQEIYDIRLERQTSKIYTENCKIVDRYDLQEGDLVFFHTGGKTYEVPNYVGIYLKEGKFVSVSSSKGVVINDLSSKYYSRNWIAGGKVK